MVMVGYLNGILMVPLIEYMVNLFLRILMREIPLKVNFQRDVSFPIILIIVGTIASYIGTKVVDILKDSEPSGVLRKASLTAGILFLVFGTIFNISQLPMTQASN